METFVRWEPPFRTQCGLSRLPSPMGIITSSAALLELQKPESKPVVAQQTVQPAAPRSSRGGAPGTRSLVKAASASIRDGETVVRMKASQSSDSDIRFRANPGTELERLGITHAACICAHGKKRTGVLLHIPTSSGPARAQRGVLYECLRQLLSEHRASEGDLVFESYRAMDVWYTQWTADAYERNGA